MGAIICPSPATKRIKDMKERRISRPGAGGPTQPVTLTPPMPGQAEGPEADQPQNQKSGWEDSEAAQARPRIVHVISGLGQGGRSEEHTSELQSRGQTVCR